jgi:taurine transport system substrate-binding protein
MRTIWTALSIWTALLVGAAAAAPGEKAAPGENNCSRVVRVGTFDQATPYALAPATRWLDDATTRTCFAYYRQPSGARALELLGRGDLDLAFMGSMPWSNAVARGAGVTAVSVLMDIKSSEGLVTCLNVRRLQELRKKRLVAPYASTTHYILLATIVEAGIDINDVTVKTAEPHEIMRLWDAGEIDGAACWGECFVHLQSTPHGMQKTPGHLLVDAGTVARWGYRTFDALVANDAFLAAEPELVSRAAEYLARANSDYTTTPDKPEWLADGAYTTLVAAFANLESSHHAATARTPLQIRQALRREGYPSVAAQVADADSYALATKSQAETLFKQKAIPVDPRALPLEAFFDDAVVKPCVEIKPSRRWREVMIQR